LLKKSSLHHDLCGALLTWSHIVMWSHSAGAKRHDAALSGFPPARSVVAVRQLIEHV
jgi:hypothetical protein